MIPTGHAPGDSLRAIGRLLHILWFSFLVVTPALGVWLASSLASYLNAPLWAALAAGLFLFPILPFGWESWSTRRKKRKAEGEPIKRVLTTGDRLTLRTLLISLAFIGALLGSFPSASFTALSTRGDWMLSGRSDATSEQLRRGLFAAAHGVEWIYEAVRDNPYEQYAEADDDLPVPEPSAGGVVGRRPPTDDDAAGGLPDDDGTGGNKPTETKHPVIDGTVAPPSGDPPSTDTPPDEAPPDEVPPDGTPPDDDDLPPQKVAATLHPAVQNMPPAAEKNIQAVGNYLRAKERDPFLRLKAIHDYAADRIAYDSPALARGEYPPQDAETVFRTKKGVCAGYARLLVALGKVTGDRIVYLTGVSRDMGGDVGGAGHAWNAAEVNGSWYLIDATWDAGFSDGREFKKQYRTNYFLVPPEVMGNDHFPDEAAWQLRERPLSRGDFMRQPVLRSDFFAAGLGLVSPDRSQISTQGQAKLVVDNPRQQKIIAEVVAKGAPGAGDGTPCAVDGVGKSVVTCDIPGEGRYEVRMFAGPRHQTQFPFVGMIEVANRR
jgi:hypothetical protein